METPAAPPEDVEPETAEAEQGTPDDSPDREAPEPEGEEGAESEEISTLVDFARAAGWEPEDIYRLKFNLEGTGEAVPLGELKDRLQEFSRKQSEIESQREALQAQEAHLRQQYEQALGGTQQLTQQEQDAMLKKAVIQRDFDSVDWDAYDEKDPGRSTLLKQKLASQFAAAEAELQQAQAQANQYRQQYQQQLLMQNQQQLMQAVPEWQNDEHRSKELPQLRQFLTQHFRQEELANLVDWRVVKLFRDAMLWQQHQAGQRTAEKQVRSAPQRVMRPGGSRSKADKEARIKQLRQNARRGSPAERRRAALEALVLSQGKT